MTSSPKKKKFRHKLILINFFVHPTLNGQIFLDGVAHYISTLLPTVTESPMSPPAKERMSLYTKVAITESGMMEAVTRLIAAFKKKKIKTSDVTYCHTNKMFWFWLFGKKEHYIEVTMMDPDTEPLLTVQVCKEQPGERKWIRRVSAARNKQSEAIKLNSSFDYDLLCDLVIMSLPHKSTW